MSELQNTQTIIDSIEKDGYAVIQDAFDSARIHELITTFSVPFQTPMINGRKGYVQFGCRRFVANPLSWGRNVIDVYTDPAMVAVGDAYIKEPIHLSYFRVYESYPSPSEVMHWHIDNKVDYFDHTTENFNTRMIHGERGLSFVLYLSDVEKGGFELARGSHKWSELNEGWKKETWDDVADTFKDEVVSLNGMPKGTLVLFDFRLIHRAQPFRYGAVRSTLLGQYFPDRLPDGEPVILNTRDLEGLTAVQKRVLGFGKPPTSENWPIGSKSEIFSAPELLSMAQAKLRSQARQFVESFRTDYS